MRGSQWEVLLRVFHRMARSSTQACTYMDTVHTDMYMNDQSLRLGKAKQLRLKTTPFFPREKEELPQAGLEPTTCTYTCMLVSFPDPPMKGRVWERDYMYVHVHV